ncbi:MAG: hypothetical protein HOA17_05250 [Candidatus Melainabacteria bacterium]|jgi:hypothetical protein|nr:hypothetical protein [Candidatus Melainabacteria bacterium]
MQEKFLVKNIFSTEEKLRVCDSVHKLKEHWINRGGYFAYPFFSLGAASYMDAREDQSRYYQWAKKFNPLLEAEFAWLYTKIQDWLQTELGKEVKYHPKQALPGFHIFLGDELFEIPVASRHVDLQYRDLDWGDLKYKPEDSLSFTAYIKLPANGGGMSVWDYSHQDLLELDPLAREAKLSAAESKYQKFQEGDIVIHSGLHYHQIAPMEEPTEEDQRISLQGHAVLADDGSYQLYW